MASRASSDASALRSPAQIPKLPGLGRSWYERGARYWAYRARLVVIWLLLLAVYCTLAFQLYRGVPRSDMSPTVRMVWDWTQVVLSGVALVWGWTKQRRDLRRQLLDPPHPQRTRETRRNGMSRSPGLARAALLPLLIAAPVLPMLAAWCVGWTVAMLTVREYPSEVGARRWLAERTAV